jgi:hypothetical protein
MDRAMESAKLRLTSDELAAAALRGAGLVPLWVFRSVDL